MRTCRPDVLGEQILDATPGRTAKTFTRSSGIPTINVGLPPRAAPVARGLCRGGLLAEMAAAFICASLSIAPTVRHSDYIESWLSVLRDDEKAIFRAASQASKASDFLLAFPHANGFRSRALKLVGRSKSLPTIWVKMGRAARAAPEPKRDLVSI
ncbi:MAG: hypothetical protein JHD35_07625 [Sphingopyxis sp.]|nr:hypothetical protein [Sphingopyxis sp.]